VSQTIVVTNPESLEDLAAMLVKLMGKPQGMPPEVLELEKLKRRETLTTKDVETLYGINVNTLCKYRSNGEGPAYIKDGEKVLYTHAAVKKYLESRRQKTHDQP